MSLISVNFHSLEEKVSGGDFSVGDRYAKSLLYCELRVG